MAQRWPKQIWIVRHGESAGNVARDAAHAGGLSRIDLPGRDVDVPLSDLGQEQAASLGSWFGEMPENARPEVVLASPYRRAVQTAAILRENAGITDAVPKTLVDERLREKEFGVLDGLTTTGIRELHADQAEFRRILGKFYHRPPGGESWCDVIFRLRSMMDTVSLHHADKRVLVIAHQVVVLCLRYLLENLDEEAILSIDREGDVANCSVTEYQFDAGLKPDGALVLKRYNFVAPLKKAGTPVTAEPDAKVAAP